MLHAHLLSEGERALSRVQEENCNGCALVKVTVPSWSMPEQFPHPPVQKSGEMLHLNKLLTVYINDSECDLNACFEQVPPKRSN